MAARVPPSPQRLACEFAYNMHTRPGSLQMSASAQHPWDGVIPQAEQEAYQAAGFGRPSGIGSRPALLIIDVQYRTVGTTPMPFMEAIKEFPTSCGEVGWAAV